eukprot:1193727-Prorocentrum_minimum.AAC.13
MSQTKTLNSHQCASYEKCGLGVEDIGVDSQSLPLEEVKESSCDTKPYSLDSLTTLGVQLFS